ncbi:MAG: hypothetical protein IPM39_21485 [Chloroflexi bacterium]|nr:hypothetical protein [Chloroflexota bacterium]
MTTNQLLRRILGFVLIGIGLSGMVIGVIGARVGRSTLDGLSAGVAGGLTLAIDSLETIADSLVLAQQTIADVNTGLQTVQTTSAHVADSLQDSQPLLANVATIAGQDLPRSVETLQAAIPNAAQAAGAIDLTLTTLNRFKIDTSILGFPIQYDLGINYNPIVPFDAAVLEIGSSLDDLPDRLRSLEASLEDTAVNLETITNDMRTLSTDLGVINSRLGDFDPLIREYIRLVTTTNDSLRLLRGQIGQQVESAKAVITVAMVWLFISQAVPLYLGVELLTGGQMVRERKETTYDEQLPTHEE